MKRKYIPYKNITFCCRDCGTRISYGPALYGKGRCHSCGNKTRTLSKETRLKISIANKGRKLSKEHKLKIGKINKGKKFSLEHRQKMSKSMLGKNKGKHHTKEELIKISKATKGKNNPRWLGGISFLPYSLKWTKTLKLKIRCRDDHICQNCGMTEEEHVKKFKTVLSVHHINYNKQNCKEDNLITVCNLCNVKANTNRDYWFAYYTYIIQHFVAKNG
jgi:hypothetical protein